MSMKGEDHVSVSLGSLLVNCPEDQVRGWARAGMVKAHKQGGRWMIHRQSLIDHARRLRASPCSPGSGPDSERYGLGYMQGRGAS